MFKWLFRKPEDKTERERINSFFSTEHQIIPPGSRTSALTKALQRSFSVDEVIPVTRDGAAVAMDGQGASLKSISRGFQAGIPDAQFFYFANQGFIGYQNCAMLAQHWLIDKACTMPARDAVRVGYDITVTDGTEVSPDVLDEIRRFDREMKLNENCEEFIRMGRVFGIRIAMFVVDTPDPKEYYLNPFNPDGVRPGSYRGITQIDPYWMAPELSAQASGNPAAIDFYEPTWWNINGMRVHKSHLVIFRNSELPDILKPSYLFGGISVPQKIYERAYAAERTANEGPMLAMTKRLNVQKIDITSAFANQQSFEERIAYQNTLRDNYGKLFIGIEEDAIQLETSLTDLDQVIMTQFQLVAAAANVPATKLLGTTPKGFNATGEYEEASYHEELESIQANDLTPLIERHHLMVIRSYIKGKPFQTGVAWGSLDAMTAAEQATVNKTKADTDAVLVNAGALDGADVRARLISDPDSGYNGIPDTPELGGFEDPEEETGPEPDDQETE